jgi:FKBP-type peptidyl-prolyl cis-trans isomerase
VRKIIALTAAAGLLVTLAACSTSAPTGSCEPVVSSGDASSIVTAKGSFGADPAAEFPTPLVIDSLQASTVTTGDGATVFPGQYATAQVTLYNGTTGEYLTSTSYKQAEAFIVRAGKSLSTITEALACQSVGSRVALVAHGSDMVGFAGITENTFSPEETVVAVFDLQGSVLGKAYGVDQIPQQGMPSVVTTPDGQPGVTVPAETPPSTLKSAVLKQGDGPTVTEGQQIYAHYLRVDWADPSSTSSSKSTWSDFGVPEILSLSDLDPSTGAGLPTGLLQSLVNQKVGSQILVVVPPAFGFPDGSAPDGVDTTATLVYVIDILGVVT